MADEAGDNIKQPTVEDLFRKIDNERRERELALIAQEHRLIPALGNIVKAWNHPDIETRAELWPKAVQALAWCLIPRTITTSVSIVAIASLILTWWQTYILSEQTKYLKLQNTLMETQLRSVSMENSNEIFRILKEEMAGPEETQVQCVDRNTLCWTDSGNFVPSELTNARIASLTLSLAPYKYIIEDSNPCIADAFSGIGMSLALRSFSKPVKYSGLESETNEARGLSTIKNNALSLIDFHSRYSFSKYFFGLVNSSEISSLEQNSYDNKSRLNCESNSPERGRLLVSLSAEKIDMHTLQQKGATFQNSNFQGTISANKLNGLRLKNSDLSEAVIVGELMDVDLKNSTIGASTFSNAKLTRSIVSGANINLAINPADAEKAKKTFKAIGGDNIVGFNAFYYHAPRSYSANRAICKLTDMMDNSDHAQFRDYAVITEIRQQSTGRFNSLSTLILKRFDNSVLIAKGEDNRGNVRVIYYPLDKCYNFNSSKDNAMFMY